MMLNKNLPEKYIFVPSSPSSIEQEARTFPHLHVRRVLV
jgi:hypothetical protein